MARRRRRKNNPFAEIKEGAIHAVMAILFFVLGAFFTLAGLGQAGALGNVAYNAFFYLFGIGFALIPALFFVLALSVFSTFRDYLGLPKTLGALLFFFSGLGLVQIILTGQGGVVGKIVANPLVMLIDVYASVIILGALLIISLILIFNTDFRFALSLPSLPRIPFLNRDSSEEEEKKPEA